MGGALAAVVCREIIIGRRIKSGRYILSPKKTLHLKSPSSFKGGIQTFGTFLESLKK